MYFKSLACQKGNGELDGLDRRNKLASTLGKRYLEVPPKGKDVSLTKIDNLRLVGGSDRANAFGLAVQLIALPERRSANVQSWAAALTRGTSFHINTPSLT